MPKPMIGIGTSAIIELSCHSLPEQCETVVVLGGVGRARSSTRTSLVRAVQPLRRSAVAAASCAPLPIRFTFMGYLLSRRASVSRWAARTRFVVRRERTASRRKTPSLLGRTPHRRMVRLSPPVLVGLSHGAQDGDLRVVLARLDDGSNGRGAAGKRGR